LGNGLNIDSNVPTEVKMDGVLLNKKIIKVSTGYYHVCVIADDKGFCWGKNSFFLKKKKLKIN
jgi:hypothetical protein